MFYPAMILGGTRTADVYACTTANPDHRVSAIETPTLFGRAAIWCFAQVRGSDVMLAIPAAHG